MAYPGSIDTTQKPLWGTLLDPSHTLAQGLTMCLPLNEQACDKSVSDAVTGKMYPMTRGSVAWYGSIGIGSLLTAPFTLAWSQTITGTIPTYTGVNAGYYSADGDNQWYGIANQDLNPTGYAHMARHNGVGVGQGANITQPANNVVTQYALTVSGSACNLYQNGILTSTRSIYSTSSFSADSRMTMALGASTIQVG